MVILAMLTLFFIKNQVKVDLNDVFFFIFFLFMMKSSYDFHRYFIKSQSVTYGLSAPIHHGKTVFEIILMIFWVQLGIWVLFFSIYSISLYGAGVGLEYPFEYIQFTTGIMLATVLGTTIALHFFSKKKYRLAPLFILIGCLWILHDIVSIIVILLFSVIYLFYSLNHTLDSYQYVHRKQRKEEKLQVWIQSIKKTIFFKETIILWRDKIFFSILFSSITIGAVSGYLAAFGDNSIFPESLKVLTERLTLTSYAFVGIYVLTVFTSVFIPLSFFLNEENTLWLLRNLPVKENTIIEGKAFALVIPFICSIPFIAYFSAFTKGESIDFLIWFLIFSFLAGVIISFPLGAKYVGKKSDILLLYCVSLLIFIILGIAISIYNILKPSFLFHVSFYHPLFSLFQTMRVSAHQ